MPDIELYNIPPTELYWRKEELQDELFWLSHRMRTAKRESTRQRYEQNIIYINNSIQRIESRMKSLYM